MHLAGCEEFQRTSIYRLDLLESCFQTPVSYPGSSRPSGACISLVRFAIAFPRVAFNLKRLL
jgi:hypothetical protein